MGRTLIGLDDCLHPIRHRCDEIVKSLMRKVIPGTLKCLFHLWDRLWLVEMLNIVFLKFFQRFSIGLRSGDWAGQTSFFDVVGVSPVLANLCLVDWGPIFDLKKKNRIDRNFGSMGQAPSYTISIKSLAVRRFGGMITRGEVLSPMNAPHTMIEDLPLLNVGTKQLDLTFSRVVLQTITCWYCLPISKLDSLVQITFFQLLIVQC